MFARVVEFMLACWLAISRFIFHYSPEESFLWKNDLVCATLIALFALLSFADKLNKMHLFTLLVALWLMVLSYCNFPMEATPPLENYLALGLLFLILAVLPSNCHLPPRPWRKFYKEKFYK